MTNMVDQIAGVAREAGAILRAKLEEPRDADEKGRADLVTDADRAAERLIYERLSAAFGGASFLLEEGGQRRAEGQGHDELLFIVDPLDGTTNFASRIPHYAVSIGVRKAGESIAGAIYDPERDELFLAERGAGARFVSPRAPSGRPSTVSATAQLCDSVVVTGFCYDRWENHDDNHAEFCALNLLTRGARRVGAATLDLAWTAVGRYDAFWERGLSPWDVAAGALIVEESGGRVTTYRGEPHDVRGREILASNGQIHQSMQQALARVRGTASS